MRLQKTENSRKSLWENLRLLSRTILDYMICIYLAIMLAVFPFYNEEGYSHIGTDKSVFFCRLGTGMGIILIIPLGVYLLLGFGRFAAEKFSKSAFRKSDSYAQGTAVSGRCGFGASAGGGIRHVRLSPTDLFALIYGGALLLSYFFTNYREAALWGERGWYMGLLPQLMLLSIYFLVSRFWKPRKKLFYLCLPVSAAVFLMGCLNRFGIYSFGLEFVNVGYISTIGNVNWYCGYAVSVMFAGVALPWLCERLKTWQRVLLMLYTAIGYLSLILQGSDSGLIALTVVMLVLLCMSTGDSSRMLTFWREMTILSVECLGIYVFRKLVPGGINFVGDLAEIFICGPVSIAMTVVSVFALIFVWRDKVKNIHREKLYRILALAAVLGSVAVMLGVLLLGLINTLHPGILGKLSENDLFTFNMDWGSHRGATWWAGFRCFAEQDILHKLVGVGPDGMWSYISGGASAGFTATVEEVFGSLRLTNAHNEWLTILADTGILGVTGYAGMMICGIRELLQGGQKNPAAAACGFCLLAYVVNGMFSFQQSMGAGTIFVMFGIGMAFLNERRKEDRHSQVSTNRAFS